jgi:hypothetical protein
MRKYALLVLCLASILLVSSQKCHSQTNKIITPLTAEDLRQVCKSYQYVVLAVELDKNMSSTDVAMAASCLNFIVGVASTVVAMDVGYYPELKLALAESGAKATAFPKMVKIVVDYIDSTPDIKKESAAGAVVAALLKAGILVPKHWTDK